MLGCELKNLKNFQITDDNKKEDLDHDFILQELNRLENIFISKIGLMVQAVNTSDIPRLEECAKQLCDTSIIKIITSLKDLFAEINKLPLLADEEKNSIKISLAKEILSFSKRKPFDFLISGSCKYLDKAPISQIEPLAKKMAAIYMEIEENSLENLVWAASFILDTNSRIDPSEEKRTNEKRYLYTKEATEVCRVKQCISELKTAIKRGTKK